MRSHARRPSRIPRQRGAALVVGLLLLAVITLLAIAGLNSTNLELVMAGNTQYYQRAFQASEIGIEQTLVTGDFVPGAPNEVTSNVAVTGSSPDQYSTTLRSDLGGAPQPAIWGNSWNSFSTYHFQIASAGASARKAQATHLQGIAVLAPYTPSFSGSSALN